MANATTSTMVIDPFIDNITATIAMCRLYLIVGILVTIVNFASLLVIVLNREMLQKYLYFAVLDIGETINGIAFVVTGAMRAELVTSHAFDQPISYSDCFFQKPWPILLLIGTQFPALVTILLAVERLLAVTRPIWFMVHWKMPMKLKVLALLVLLQAVSIGLAALSAATCTEIATTEHCSIINSVSPLYSNIHFIAIVLAYCISFVAILAFYNIRRIQKLSSQQQTPLNDSYYRRQFVLFLYIAGSSVIAASIPSILMLAILWQLLKLDDLAVAFAYSLTGLNSMTNVVAYFVFREDYKKQIASIFKFYKSVLVLRSNKITNISPS